MVPPAGLEPASPKATDFKSAVFTDFTKGADCGIRFYQPERQAQGDEAEKASYSPSRDGGGRTAACLASVPSVSHGKYIHVSWPTSRANVSTRGLPCGFA